MTLPGGRNTDGVPEMEEGVVYEECVNCPGRWCVHCGGLGVVPHTHLMVDPDGELVEEDVFSAA